MADREIHSGQIYRHFKNKLYQILAVANHSEKGEKLVIYQQLYGKFEVYARPLEMFLSPVDKAKYPQVEQYYRFELVDRDNLGQTDTILAKTDGCNVPSVSQEISSETNGSGAQDKLESESIETVGQQESKSEGLQSEQNAEIETEAGEYAGVNPNLIKFLDADTYEEKRGILIRMRDELDDKLIDDIAASMDVMVEKGDIDSRFVSLLSCIDTLAKYEINRFR